MLAQSNPGFLLCQGKDQAEPKPAKHLLLFRGVGSCYSQQRFKTSEKDFTWPLLAWATASSLVHSLRECKSEENTTENSIPLFFFMPHSLDRDEFHYTLTDS